MRIPMKPKDLSHEELLELLARQEQMQDALLRSEERYRSFIQNSSEGIWCFELKEPMPTSAHVEKHLEAFAHGAYLSECNDATAKMYGFERAEEIIGRPLSEFMSLSDSANVEFLTAFILSEYRLMDAESVEVDRLGKTKYISNSLMGVIKDGFLLRAWGVQRDTTPGRVLEEELRSAKKVAEDASLAKSRFLANISHEIRTPLGVIIGFSDLCASKELSPDDREDYLDRVRRNAKQLLVLVDELLDFARIEADKLSIELQEFELLPWFRQISDSLSIRATEKDIDLHLHLDRNLKTVRTDPIRLQQILFNIIGNAIKFTEKGSVRVEAQLIDQKVDQTVDGSSRRILEVNVIDTGIGIRPEDRSRLFQPFSQLDPSNTRNYSGTGLGLALSQKLALALGGDIQLVDSSPQQGSTFRIRIPVEIIKRQYQGRDSGLPFEPEAGQNHLNNIRILVAEDSDDSRFLIKQVLSSLGTTNVVLALNGAEAVDKAFQMDFDLILMDLQMPIMDGYEAIRKLRSRGFKKPVLALTAHALPEEREKCLNAGFNDHLAKPANSKDLVAKILYWKEKGHL
jgi:signal transduction histidine kinase/ActR/RegA family two-component response regulator